MAGFWESIVRFFTGESPVQSRPVAPAPRVRHPVPATRRDVSRRRITVEADRRPLWQIRGWRKDGNRLIGAYRLAAKQSFAGEIDLSGSYPEFFIVNPPPRVLTGSHASCFRKRGAGRYYVHFGRSSKDVDAGILGIEKILAIAIELNLGRRT